MRSLLVALSVTLLLAGCSGEAAPVDDGSYSSLQAGASTALEAVGVQLVAPTVPPGVDLDAVEQAVADSDLPVAVQGAREDGDGLALDPTMVAGLLGSVGNQATATARQEHFVLLVFDDPASAVVFAEGSPEIFSDQRADRAKDGYLAGTVLGYYAPADGVDETTSFSNLVSGLAGV